MSEISTSPSASSPQPVPASDEKTAQVVLYTLQNLIWGTISIKEKIRINMWLRTSAAPEVIHITNCKMLFQGAGAKQAPLSVKEAHIFSSDVVAYHLLPPEKEPLDYDPTEPNRHLETVLAFAGAFRFEGSVLLSNLNSIGHYVETTRERFISFYDAEICYPFSNSQQVLKVPQVLVKLLTASFAIK